MLHGVVGEAFVPDDGWVDWTRFARLQGDAELAG